MRSTTHRRSHDDHFTPFVRDVDDGPSGYPSFSTAITSAECVARLSCGAFNGLTCRAKAMFIWRNMMKDRAAREWKTRRFLATAAGPDSSRRSIWSRIVLAAVAEPPVSQCH
jgi:hypothetical protein